MVDLDSRHLILIPHPGEGCSGSCRAYTELMLPSHTSCITGDSEEKPVVPVHKMGQLTSKVNTRSNRKNWVENVVDKDECIPTLVRSTGQAD